MNTYVTGAAIKSLRERRGILYWYCNRHGLFRKKI